MMKQPPRRDRKRLVLIGGGHAHLQLINHIPQLIAGGVEVTVIDSRAELFYSGMMPAVLGGLVSSEAAQIPVHKIVTRGGGRFVQQPVTHIDQVRGVAVTDAAEFPWDVASIAIGSRVQYPIPVATRARVIGAKPVARLPEIFSTAVQLLESIHDRPVQILFVGGGASAVELSGNLAGRLQRSRPELAQRLQLTIVSRGSALVPSMPQSVQRIAGDSLTRRGVRLRLGVTPRAVSASAVELEQGASLPADLTVFCTGLSAPGVIAASGLPHDEEGALLVNDTLRTAEAPIYGGGDCVGIKGRKLARIGVHAVRQGGVLLHNVVRELSGDAPSTLEHYVPPESPMLILNLGDGTGVLVKGERVMHGRLPYVLKERIDWAFVRSGGTRTRPALLGPPRPRRAV